MNLINRSSRLRLRRTFRRRRREVEIAAIQAEDEMERLFFKRLGRLVTVRRFIIGWVGLFVLLTASVGLQARGLGQYYQKIAPAEGGTMREGVVGTFTGASPLYATSVVDSSVSRLLFSGLFTYNKNNQLAPDLAEKWTGDENGLTYTVVLRKNVKWHDGKPFTADDVVFTYHTIQNPDAKSPLLGSWQGVEVTKVDAFTVRFVLPSPLAAFPYSLTNGIVPQHILANIPATQLRSIPFNISSPVGTGPFKWNSVEVLGTTQDKRSEQVELHRDANYRLGAPKIETYVLRTFPDESAMIKAFEHHELTAVVGASQPPSEAGQDTTINTYNVPLAGTVMLFFNLSSPVMQPLPMRQALASATDRPDLLASLNYPVVATDGPLLRGLVGYDPTITQRGYSLSEAQQMLDQLGYTTDPATGMRSKDGKKLVLRFATQNSNDYALLSQNLQKQWKKLGVDLDVKLYTPEDMQSSVLLRHDYDVLLYGITIGQDPDVFAYWHSSQADVRSASRLNFSEYKSTAADKALEAGRTRTDPVVRALKYKPFLQAWQADVPAIALYQPRFLYITRSELVGFDATRLNSSVQRLDDVQNWTVLMDRVIK